MDSLLLTNGDIRLRPMTEADEAGVAAAGRDPDIRQMPWFGEGFQDSWAGPWVRRAIDEWAADRNRVFSILDGEGTFAGVLVVTRLREDGIEIAYWVLPEHRRKGMATAAVRAVLPWARERHPDARIWATTRPDNAASQRVLANCGFVERERRDLAYFDWTG